MDHYLEIRVLPDAELDTDVLMATLFTKLHRALGKRGKGDIGVSFPRFDMTLGSCLRLHGTLQALQELEAGGWRKGFTDYCQCSPVQLIPAIQGWRTVSRVQDRHTPLNERPVPLPYVDITSLSSQQQFRLFICHGEVAPVPAHGTFNYYGLSTTATIPWF